MYLSKFQIFNYKSFRDSGVLEFKPGINIIVGANNSGKTALLEALTLNFFSKPHRSLKILAEPNSSREHESSAKISFTFKKNEFLSFISHLPQSLGILHKSDERLTLQQKGKIFQRWLDNVEPSELIVSLIGERDNSPQNDIQIKGLSPDISLYYEVEGNAQSRFYNSDLKVFYLQKNNDHQFYINEDNGFSEGRKYLPLKLFTSFRSQIYRFKAERPNQESYFFGSDSELEPNAENLGEVLNILQGRATKNIFERYNQCISAIFPDIKEIAVQPKPLNPRGNDSILEIRVWPKEAAENDREDLSFPLSECGTGISQVLAILYIVITSAEPRIIIIDEPQSFLHPGAAKKLIGIFKQFPQHQYFIATHSPALITAANPSTIVKLRHEDGETKALVMKSEDLKEQSTLLAELGVSLSDVFGADSILWVEGPTEELCFPMILEKIAKKPLRGIQILAVKNTGDLEGKRAEIIFDIYDKLSGGNSLFPPTIGFIFDREGRLDSDIEKLKNRSKKPVEFLERRMYENYLLHPKAIAAIINDDDKERTQPLSAVEVQEWIDKAKQESSYLLKNVKPNQLSESEWLCQVDGAKLLSDIFSNLSETRVAFRKTTHSPKITEWLIDNEPEQLSELEKPLVSLLE